GTTAGTVLVSSLGWSNLTNVNGTLYFTVTTGDELWKTDGTSAGTVLVKAFDHSPYFNCPNSLTNVNGTLFFTAYDSINGVELWKSNGTAAGTTLVKDINNKPLSAYPHNV